MACSKRSLVISSVVAVLVVAVVAFCVYWFGFHDKNSDSSKPEDYTLKLLVVVTRHGNREPLYDLENSGYTTENTTLWPFGTGLTKVGRQELYNMGAKIRSLYGWFLDDQYFEDEVYVTSTTVERVVQSGMLFMAGLYPPTGNQLWNSSLLYQPIPVTQDSLDKTVQATSGCTAFTTLQTAVKSEFKTKWASNISYFTEAVSSALNSSVSGTYGCLTIWDTLLSVDVEGYTLPSWAEDIYPGAMFPMMNDMYVEYVTSSDEMVRLLIGPFFANMIDIMESKVNGSLSPDRQLFYFSGHDDTLITLQAAVGVDSSDMVGVVNPGSAMIFELHQNATTEAYFIRIFYVDGRDPDLEPAAVDLSDCEDPCDWTVFLNNTAKFTNITSSNWNEACSS